MSGVDTMFTYDILIYTYIHTYNFLCGGGRREKSNVRLLLRGCLVFQDTYTEPQIYLWTQPWEFRTFSHDYYQPSYKVETQSRGLFGRDWSRIPFVENEKSNRWWAFWRQADILSTYSLWAQPQALDKHTL